MSEIAPVPVRHLLTEQQRLALRVADRHGVSYPFLGSMRALARRGLVTRELRTVGGKTMMRWTVTETGRQVAAQLRAENEPR